MGLPVAAYQAGSVNGKHHMQILKAYIMNDLVIRPLEERRIHREDRNAAAHGKACRKGHRMLLRDAHVKKAVWEAVPEPFQACPVRHGSRDRDHVRDTVRKLAHHRAEHVLIAGVAVLCLWEPVFDLKRFRPVKSGRMLHRRLISLPLHGLHMNHDGAGIALCFPEDLRHLGNVMPVYRTDILDPQIFEEHPRDNDLLDAVLCIADAVDHPVAVYRDLVERVFHTALQVRIGVGRAQTAQVNRKAAHIFRDGHFVVIENNNEIGLELRRVVQRLIRHAAGKRTVPDHGDNAVGIPAQVPRPGIAQACGDGCGAVSGVKGIAVTLLPFRESAQPAPFAEPVKGIHPACQDLVGIGLMPDVPDDLILRKIQRQMQRHRQLHHTQV